MNVSRSFVRFTALTVVVAMPLMGMSGIASAKSAKATAAKCARHAHKCQKGGGGGGGGGGTGGLTPNIIVTVAPNPLVETGQSEIHAIVQVEANDQFANDNVFIYSQQLVNSCGSVVFSQNQGRNTSVNLGTSATVLLDNDGNATVELSGTDCAPGSSVLEADLVKAPYFTATTTLVANPPVPTTAGVTGYPNPEVETGDGTLTGSNVYAVFYFEDNPVYAETPVEISSAQLQNRCVGETWDAGNNGSGNATGGTTTLDDDGNAVFLFEGISCAPGDSTVIADLMGGTHDTFATTFTISPPTPTV
jgi:hypothetical protein